MYSAHAAADPVLLNDWHAVADLSALRPGEVFRTRVLDTPLKVASAGADGALVAQREDGRALHATSRYGFAWVCLGNPERDIVDIPEAREPDRLVTTGGSLGVHTSGPRIVENFLDMGHFPFVHTGYLGAEPHTEVLPYQVNRLAEGGLIATECRFFQPLASPAATAPVSVDYIYKVLRPLITGLYKTNIFHTDRYDIIYLFVQPVDETHSIAHPFIVYMPDGTSVDELRWFQQLILAQDKPILENQRPRRLPLSARMEMPVAADKASVAYRSWLRQLGISYGTIESRRDSAELAPAGLATA